MRLATVCDLEPGMWFRSHTDGPALRWAGVERIVSRFPGKRRVRVLTVEGVSWVSDTSTRVYLISWERP